MARPRSILGLLFHLMRLYARRRPVWTAAAACLVVAALVWPRHHDAGRAAGAGLQLAVLHDGFAITHPGDGGHRVIELDRQGQERRATTVRHGDDPRVVGTRAGAAVAWQDGQKVRLALVDGDKGLSTWGKSVRQLCEGVASNDTRFAIGWLESDDRVWIVHGPVAEGEAEVAEAIELPLPAPDAVRSEWCGVASAGDNVTMFWRDADKLKFGMCTRRRCSGLIATFKLDRRLPIIGFGCVDNACLVATRDDAGHARVALLTETSKLKWTKPLDASSGAVSILGVGDRGFVVGQLTRDGAEVLRFDRNGAATSLWRDGAATSAPALAWSSGRLLIARHHGDTLVHETLALAR
jgi:hypothetical protein